MASAGSIALAQNQIEKTPERLEFEASLKEMQRPINLEELLNILDSTIKYDKPDKLITFLTNLLTYTAEDQLNIAFNSESSTGKSYIPLELSWYFPQEDVLELAYCSPQSFFHEQGTLLPDPTDDTEDETRRRKIIYVNLEQKIIIFLDMPHDQLLQRLRPLLSHDRKELVSKIVDKRERSGTRTKTVHIIGFPTVVFCSSKFSLDDQERTRMLLLSPETSQEKLRNTILFRIQKESDRQAFREYMESDPRRQWLKSRVQHIKMASIENILITEEDRRLIAQKFFESRPTLTPRHQRDISRLLALIKAHALLNFCSRQRTPDAHSIIATSEDVVVGFNLYEQIAQSNELGLPPEVFDIYQRIFSKLRENGITRKDLASLYFAEFHKPLSGKRQDEILKLLNGIGLIREEADQNDRRRMLIYCATEKLNTPTLGGVQSLPPTRRVFNSIKDPKGTFASDVAKNSSERDSPALDLKPSIGEALGKMRDVFVEGTEEEWISLAKEIGLSEGSAESLFERLKGDELFWFDREGHTFWRWVKP
ncbi:MAG TPA: hypothetical protein VK487_03775 [Candidatus Bathyarchaeia archaeon]|nr:hypothetical protein [Candidatus Bathyarchaeia archaeon]